MGASLTERIHELRSLLPSRTATGHREKERRKAAHISNRQCDPYIIAAMAPIISFLLQMVVQFEVGSPFDTVILLQSLTRFHLQRHLVERVRWFPSG